MNSNPDSSSLKQSQEVEQVPDAAHAELPHDINGQHTLNQAGETGMRMNAQENMMKSTIKGTVSKTEPIVGAKSAVR